MAGAWRRSGHPDPVEHTGLGITYAIPLSAAARLRPAAEAGGTGLQPEQLASADVYGLEHRSKVLAAPANPYQAVISVS